MRRGSSGLKEIEAVRLTLPQGAFQLPVTALDLPDNVTEALQPFENVGEIMLRFLIDENRVRRALSDFPPEAFRRLQEALDKLVIPEVRSAARGRRRSCASRNRLKFRC